MKRLTILMLAALMGCMAIHAEEISQAQAFQKAQQFMPGKQFKQVDARRAPGKAERPFYVFNAEKNGGFVIVSGDDRTVPVLGYSRTGNIDMEKMPEKVQ